MQWNREDLDLILQLWVKLSILRSDIKKIIKEKKN